MAATALTQGDPEGVAPEITGLAWSALRDDPDAAFFVIGDPGLFDSGATQVIDEPASAAMVFPDALPILPGPPATDRAGGVIASIETAVRHASTGHARAVVTNPISKAVLYEAGFPFPGHTEMLADLTDAPSPPVMMLVGGGLRVALLTIHLPLADVPKALSREQVLTVSRTVRAALVEDFGVSAPRLALCGLNPHAGEGGALGREEIEILNPAAAQLRAEGLVISDARSADTLFHAEARAGYDAVIACYHDQGLIPVKTLDFHGGVNVTLGLPIVRTSPDHGAGFDIAGKGAARPDSLVAALKLAAEIAARRAAAP